jgi:beta-fructofuranosidase
LDVSIAYLCGDPNILEEGICFLTFEPDVKKVQGYELSEFYDTPYREQYHFVPFKNWINDPNGLC